MVSDNRISAVLISSDLEGCRDFYENKVGLEWVKDPDGNTIALFQPE